MNDFHYCFGIFVWNMEFECKSVMIQVTNRISYQTLWTRNAFVIILSVNPLCSIWNLWQIICTQSLQWIWKNGYAHNHSSNNKHQHHYSLRHNDLQHEQQQAKVKDTWTTHFFEEVFYLSKVFVLVIIVHSYLRKDVVVVFVWLIKHHGVLADLLVKILEYFRSWAEIGICVVGRCPFEHWRHDVSAGHVLLTEPLIKFTYESPVLVVLKLGRRCMIARIVKHIHERSLIQVGYV